MVSSDNVVYLGGRIIPEGEAGISIRDRGFLYGDGLFETIRVHLGQPFLWKWHVTRFMDSAATLGIPLVQTADSLLGIARELIHRNNVTESVMRITLSRGVGQRGYGVTGEEQHLTRGRANTLRLALSGQLGDLVTMKQLVVEEGVTTINLQVQTRADSRLSMCGAMFLMNRYRRIPLHCAMRAPLPRMNWLYLKFTTRNWTWASKKHIST